MKRFLVGCISVVAFLMVAGWVSDAHAQGFVWCHITSANYAVKCDQDASGYYYGHSGPDGRGTGIPLSPGHGSSIVYDGGSPPAIYRLYNFTTKVHLLTGSHSEAQAANQYSGFSFEQIMARFLAAGTPGTLPLYRASANVNGDFLFTTNAVEAEYSLGYTYNGVAGYVYYSGGPGRCPLYRMYDAAVGMHFYTVSYYEYTHSPINQEGNMGWVIPASGTTCPN